MLLFKKTVASFILPPGILIVILLSFGTILVFRKYKKIGATNISFGIILWVLSIAPVSHFLLSRLESDFYRHVSAKGDVIILLGGHVFNKVPDLSGWGFPDGDMLGRMVTAVRLQKRLNIPIIVSFGKANEDGDTGAMVIKRLLMDLGVSEDRIILENSSRDTYENVKFSMEICRRMGLKTPILLTAAYHLKRAYWVSRHLGMNAVPFPAYFTTRNGYENTLSGLLPDSENLARVSMALHEFLGLLYYQV